MLNGMTGMFAPILGNGSILFGFLMHLKILHCPHSFSFKLAEKHNVYCLLLLVYLLLNHTALLTKVFISVPYLLLTPSKSSVEPQDIMQHRQIVS